MQSNKKETKHCCNCDYSEKRPGFGGLGVDYCLKMYRITGSVNNSYLYNGNKDSVPDWCPLEKTENNIG